MSIFRLKEKILEKKIKKKILNASCDTVSQNNIESVGVLSTKVAPYTTNLVNELKKELQLNNIQLFEYSPSSKDNTIEENVFSNKDINWHAQFTKESLVNFINTPFSLLIGYFNEDNMYLKNAVLQSKSDFKVAAFTTDENLYDLVINTALENTKEFVAELKKYLVALQKLKI